MPNSFLHFLITILSNFIFKTETMKKITVAALFLFAGLPAFSQDSTRVEQYCDVLATPRLLSNRVTIDIDYGEKRSIWKDNRLKDEEGRVKKFNSVIDALNYMGNNGWTLVNAFPVNTGTNNSASYVYHYVFKKTFLRSESAQTD